MKSVWEWRNLRNFGFSIGFWPLEWTLGFHRFDDEFGGVMEVHFGPFFVAFNYSGVAA